MIKANNLAANAANINASPEKTIEFYPYNGVFAEIHFLWIFVRVDLN